MQVVLNLNPGEAETKRQKELLKSFVVNKNLVPTQHCA
jgi:hypothetical protein